MGCLDAGRDGKGCLVIGYVQRIGDDGSGPFGLKLRELSWLRALTATVQPSSARRNATDRPIPELAPVTQAIRDTTPISNIPPDSIHRFENATKRQGCWIA